MFLQCFPILEDIIHNLCMVTTSEKQLIHRQWLATKQLNVTTISEKTFELPFAQGHLEETPDVMKSALGPLITKTQNKMFVDCSQKCMSVRKIFLSPVFWRSTQT